MNTKDFSEINITISVKEQDFLTQETFHKLLQAESMNTIASLLAGSVYDLQMSDLECLETTENKLMTALTREYRWAFEESPDRDLVSIFALFYVYHNLKILLKAKMLGKDLSPLLIPIGSEGQDELAHLVQTLHSDVLESDIVEEIGAIWSMYLTYQNSYILEVGVDLAYFKHLKKLSLKLPRLFQEIVVILIDFYNIISVKRAFNQGKTSNAIYQILSDEGSLPARSIIKMIENDELINWFQQLNGYIDEELLFFEDKIRQSTISIVELEYLSDMFIAKYLENQIEELDGPIPLARYLLRREFEVKNLRLIISSHHNHIDIDRVAERMRPLYGR